MTEHHITAKVGATVAPQHYAQPLHMQTVHSYSNATKAAVVPASWNVGTFHQNNPIYNQRVIVMQEAGPRGASARLVSFLKHFLIKFNHFEMESAPSLNTILLFFANNKSLEARIMRYLTVKCFYLNFE